MQSQIGVMTMNKKLLNHIYQVAEPVIFCLLGFFAVMLFLGESALASLLYSLILVGCVTVFESAASLIVGLVKGIKVLFAMKKMQAELSKMANKEIKGE